MIKERIKSIFFNNKKNINNKNLKTNSLICLFIFGLLAIFSIHFISYRETKSIKLFNISENASVKINDKKEENGNLKNILSNNSFKTNDKVIIKMNMPKKITQKNLALSTYSCNCIMTVYLDNKQIYEIGKGCKYGDIIGTELLKINLDDNCAKKEIRIELTVLDSVAVKRLGNIYVGNVNDIDNYYTRLQIVDVYMSNFLIAFSVIFIVFNWICFFKYGRQTKGILIAFTSIAGSGWIIANNSIATIYGNDAVTKYFMEYESLYFFIYLILKIFYIKMKDVRQRKYLKALKYITLFYILLANVLRFFEIVYFQEILWIFHLIVLVCMAVYYIISIINIREYADVFLVSTGLLLGTIAYLTIYSFGIVTLFADTDIISLVIFLLGIYMFTSLINQIKKTFMNEFERKTLLNKAYVDSLTNINNRRACEQYLNEINANINHQLIVCSFDLNGLKEINDNYGHEKGDELIIAFSDVLKNIFNDKKNDFIGRMGGDEFIAITNINNNDNNNDITKRIKKLEEKVENINLSKKYDFTISYAYGDAVFDKNEDDDIWNTYNKADNLMYANKHKQKDEASLHTK